MNKQSKDYKLFLYVVAWVDKTTRAVVDAGLYRDEIPTSKDPKLVPAMVGMIEGDRSNIAKLIFEDQLLRDNHFDWIAGMPTIQWQLSWEACQDVPCYASPTPPNPAISPQILGG